MAKKRVRKAPEVRVLAGRTGEYPHLHRIVACEERLEEASHFLARALQKPRPGRKPVLLHSLRVGFGLLASGAHTDVVIAGLLHDVLEKSRITRAQITRRFGPGVGAMVQAVTNDPRIVDVYERYADSLERCAALGPGALAVRASDLMDNADRALARGSRARFERIARKLAMLIDTCRRAGVEAPLLAELVKRLRRVEKVRKIALVPKNSDAPAKTARLPLGHARRR